MNHLHLQETARHYANLAEQYRKELAEEQQLNEDLLGLVDALCEELGIDAEELLSEMKVLGSIKSGFKKGGIVGAIKGGAKAVGHNVRRSGLGAVLSGTEAERFATTQGEKAMYNNAGVRDAAVSRLGKATGKNLKGKFYSPAIKTAVLHDRPGDDRAVAGVAREVDRYKNPNLGRGEVGPEEQEQEGARLAAASAAQKAHQEWIKRDDKFNRRISAVDRGLDRAASAAFDAGEKVAGRLGTLWHGKNK
jgi:hypothetical protein